MMTDDDKRAALGVAVREALFPTVNEFRSLQGVCELVRWCGLPWKPERAEVEAALEGNVHAGLVEKRWNQEARRDGYALTDRGIVKHVREDLED